MEYSEYLQTRNYKKKTLESYLYYRDVFLKWLEGENLTLETCHYTDLLSYTKALKPNRSQSNLNGHIRGVKYYYEYLQKEGAINHNPAQKLQIRGRGLQLPADLLAPEELDKLYQEHPAETLPQKRNKVLLGLIVYQGLQERELTTLEAQDINLERGTIKVKPSGKSNGRTLKLEAVQILLLQQFISEILPEMKNQNIKSFTGQLTYYLKKRYPKFKNLLHLRTCLISHWAAKKNLREVQYMAGHKNLVSTEVYKQVNLQDLKKALDQFHPLK